jgi:Glycosyl transferase family 2
VPELAFVMSPQQNWYLREFAETLIYELGQQGAPSALHLDGFPAPRPEMVYVLVAPHEYLKLEGDGALPDDEILKRTIFLCADSPAVIDQDKDTKLLRRGGAVFDLDARSVALRRRTGIPSRYLRPGYSKLRDRFDPEVDRPIDVMFLGAHSLRRTRQLARCARVLAPRNCLLQISDASHPNPGASTSFIADGKWDLLAHTKVLLNVHRGEDSYIEWLRVLDAIHSGAVVVTEHSAGMSPLVAGEHLLVASPDSLGYVLDAALRDSVLLQKVRTSAYEHVRSWLPFALWVSVFRATAVEIVGRSVTSTASLGHRGNPRPEQWAMPPAMNDLEADATHRRLKEVSLEVIGLRRDIARLEHVIRSGEATEDRDRACETPAWSFQTTPRVTVVTALSNHAEVIRATLESLAGSWFRDFEIVVVDDGSTDGSNEIVREWMRLHPRVPALLARHPTGQGLGAARNTGVDHARGPYILTLDAGDEIYPRCLEVLVGTLDALAEPAFAYPMLEVFGMTGSFVAADGDYLLNVFGWEPRRLLRWRRLDALAMIRSERLRELGGFASEVDLSGWEDYDLWCRMAERDLRGQLVPQILGRYRASLDRLTGLSNIPPVAALAERARGFLAGAGSNM